MIRTSDQVIQDNVSFIVTLEKTPTDDHDLERIAESIASEIRIRFHLGLTQVEVEPYTPPNNASVIGLVLDMVKIRNYTQGWTPYHEVHNTLWSRDMMHIKDIAAHWVELAETDATPSDTAKAPSAPEPTIIDPDDDDNTTKLLTSIDRHLEALIFLAERTNGLLARQCELMGDTE